MRKTLVLLESTSFSKKLPLVFVKHVTIPAAAAATINPSEMIKCVLEGMIQKSPGNRYQLEVRKR